VQLSSADVVRIWELGLQQPRWRLGGLLLAPLLPDRTQHQLLALPIGERNEYLIALHRQLAGERLTLMVECPECRHRLEFTLEPAALAPREIGDVTALEVAVSGDGWSAVVRPLSTLDLGAVAHEVSIEDAARELRRRCVIGVEIDGRPAGPDDLDETMFMAIADRLVEIDGGADVPLALQCVDCGARWRSLFDAADIVWQEISVQARHILDDVHALATAYGWTESDVLALSPRRRKYYLELTR
jgi:hypothetical protein